MGDPALERGITSLIERFVRYGLVIRQRSAKSPDGTPCEVTHLAVDDDWDYGDLAGTRYQDDGRWPAVPGKTTEGELQHRPLVIRGHQLHLGDWVLSGANEVCQVVQTASADGDRPALIRPMGTTDRVSIGPNDVITVVHWSPPGEAVPPVDTSNHPVE